MRAMRIEQIGPIGDRPGPLVARDVEVPTPAPGEILIRVTVCGVCHTELDEIEGRTPPPRLPVTPGHQVVGRVHGIGAGATGFAIGDRVGAGWIFSACGTCGYCRSGRENLCDAYQATGRDADGGYAEFMTVPAAFAYPIPEGLADAEAAPLLCAGAVGYRALRLTGLEDGQRLGLTGFGASAHLVLQTAHHLVPRSEVYVFARRAAEREFAMGLGAAWAGAISDVPPHSLDAIIDTTPAWLPVLESLRHLVKGGRLVINAIRKEDGDRADLLALDYAGHLWLEKSIQSVANVTRTDVAEFLEVAARIPLRAEVREYPLEDANRALREIREREIRGAKVLRIGDG
ncbi:MAG: zinc-dependent alcohol dehydrogenase family protein [Chloroflexi bacterium]|nr:zinc-dependent alcohol dehydrogenase family protein [Chloroflexota bacterium]